MRRREMRSETARMSSHRVSTLHQSLLARRRGTGWQVGIRICGTHAQTKADFAPQVQSLAKLGFSVHLMCRNEQKVIIAQLYFDQPLPRLQG